MHVMPRSAFSIAGRWDVAGAAPHGNDRLPGRGLFGEKPAAWMVSQSCLQPIAVVDAGSAGIQTRGA
ncbi:hypothetical protein STRTUCAR8_01761 [Streptomyces turgidiscabies Car8]|uniref:Uncharacterized protein n=1 Tax=Streptomyces turgidiscabies (strain Car8) TaxID=698760 RepID=L7F331_STRT8|nr:hypothetical protein STRTUCAR8_01761 [Streptomyces turgidiscabies Car8]